MRGINLVGKIDHKIIQFSLTKDREEEPALFLYKEGRFGYSAIIPLESAFKYNEPKTAKEKFAVMQECTRIGRALGLPTDIRSLAQIAAQIQDKLDELCQAKPGEEWHEEQGEAIITMNGETFTREVKM